MRKISFSGLLFCTISLSVLSQKIDSLLNVLPTLRDSAKIDCQNALSLEYILAHKKDSAIFFESLAYLQSQQINYVHGIAVSLLRKARIVRENDEDNVTSEKLARESINLFHLTNNKKELADSYHELGASLFARNKYDEALDNLKAGNEISLQTNKDYSFAALETMTDVYRETGEYDKLMDVQQKMVQSERNIHDTSVYTEHELWVMGLMNMLIEEYTKALSYWRELFIIRRLGNHVWNHMEYAHLLTLANQYDSALYYYNQFDSAEASIITLRMFLVSKGEYYIAIKEYAKALPLLLQALNSYNKKMNDLKAVKRVLLDVAKCYTFLNKNDSALLYVSEGLDMALQTKSKPYIRDGYEILYFLYKAQHKTDSAFYYYQNYIAVKEAVMNEQTRGRLAAYTYQNKIELLDKERQLQLQQLEQTAQQKKFLVTIFIAVLLVGMIFLRSVLLKRKNEVHLRRIAEEGLILQKTESKKIEVGLQQLATELEMKALRAQMSPHFIFNCLSSINRFIIRNETEAASDYLTKFSRLIRQVLNNSRKQLIPLEDELEMLRLYLDLERLRFKNKFDYNIIFKNEINESAIFIPPLLMQPFAENAIWHGLMNKEGRGQLDITLSMEKDILCCTIVDNGIGRNKASELKSKSAARNKPMGLQITAERLALFNGNTNKEAFFEIEDVIDQDDNITGTRVILNIRVQDDEH
jgi:sensor histidine kinase YesM